MGPISVGIDAILIDRNERSTIDHPTVGSLEEVQTVMGFGSRHGRR